jgi:CRP/FNR family transcriptional regulator, cyclic AMP receptor protein
MLTPESSPAARRPLLRLDPDLGRLLDQERFARAQSELIVRVVELGPEWDAAPLERAGLANTGLLLVEGIVAREIEAAGTVASTELLGPGDLLRPWRAEREADVLAVAVRWQVLAPLTVAVLDRQVTLALGRWPEIGAILLDRVNERAHRLAITQAIAQLTGIERRLHALLWHLAGRFGRVTGDGVVVRLGLSHRMLGQIVGARRPTVSTALGALAREGRIRRRDDGAWLLLGEPPALDPGPVQRAAAALARPA